MTDELKCREGRYLFVIKDSQIIIKNLDTKYWQQTRLVV